MKTIFILTDFSENATHAAKGAVMLIEKLRTNVFLYHTYYDSPVIPAYAGGSMVIDEFTLLKEESTAKLAQLANKLKYLVMDLSKNRYCPEITYQTGEGSLGHNISAILKEKDVELVVMGSSSNSTFHHLFFGSDTLSVIENSSCPVVVVPAKVEFKKIQKVTLATAFELADINAITYLLDLGKILNFELEIVHVSRSGETENQVKRQAIQTHVNVISQSNISYKEIRGKDVIHRLNNHCKENGSDILALVHYGHGFFSNILTKSNSEEALLNHHIPLMIIPAKIES